MAPANVVVRSGVSVDSFDDSDEDSVENCPTVSTPSNVKELAVLVKVCALPPSVYTPHLPRFTET